MTIIFLAIMFSFFTFYSYIEGDDHKRTMFWAVVAVVMWVLALV